jgi:hypothetical protein
MTVDLLTKLSEQSVDSDILHQTVRYCVAEVAEDIPPEEMIGEMINAGSAKDVHDALKALAISTDLLDNVCLFALSAIWDTPGYQSAVTSALAEAKQKLPIVEIGIVAASALYVIYLLKTGGIRRTERKVVRRPDGTFEYEEVVEYADPSSIIGELIRIFSRKGM